jgi:tRNA (guanine-N7-)-methyltransferase
LTPAVLRALHKALRPGGRFVFQTDNAPFARYARAIVPALFAWEESRSPWPDAPKGRTLREIEARRRGLAVVRAEGVRLDLDEAEVEVRVRALPEPTFDANRPAHRGERRGVGRRGGTTRRRIV